MKTDENLLKEKLLNNIDPCTQKLKVIFWVGAGVDIDWPTELPLGNELTDFLLENACPNQLKQKIKTLENEKKHHYLHKLYGKPRLESVIECFQILEAALKPEERKSFLQGFSSFMNCSPNALHYALAFMLQKGAHIVTTNYDDCIIKAYKNQFGKELSLKKLNSYGYYCYQIDNEYVGKIYHIHGVAADVGTLGASLSQLKNGLPIEFKENVIKWLREGYYFVFMGYSAGDSLDVNPFFESLPIFPQSCGIFVSHKKINIPKITKLEKMSINREILSCFADVYAYEGMTSKFMESLVSLPKNIVLIQRKMSWQMSYLQRCMEFNEEIRIGLSLQLCNSLGINSKKILPRKWWLLLSKMEQYIEPWYIKYYGFAIGKQIGNKQILNYFRPENTDTDLYVSDFYAACHQYDYAARCMGTPRTLLYRLCSGLSRNEHIGWDISTGLNRWATYIEREVMDGIDDIEDVIETHSSNICYLISAFKIVSENFMYMEQLSQCYTAERHCVILKVFLNARIDAERELEKIVIGYKDISYLNGVIGTEVICLLYHAVEIYRRNNRLYHISRGRKMIVNMTKEIMENCQFNYWDSYLKTIYFFIQCILRTIY